MFSRHHLKILSEMQGDLHDCSTRHTSVVPIVAPESCMDNAVQVRPAPFVGREFPIARQWCHRPSETKGNAPKDTIGEDSACA
jgi:hypothetical protein